MVNRIAKQWQMVRVVRHTFSLVMRPAESSLARCISVMLKIGTTGEANNKKNAPIGNKTNLLKLHLMERCDKTCVTKNVGVRTIIFLALSLQITLLRGLWKADKRGKFQKLWTIIHRNFENSPCRSQKRRVDGSECISCHGNDPAEVDVTTGEHLGSGRREKRCWVEAPPRFRSVLSTLSKHRLLLHLAMDTHLQKTICSRLAG